MAEIKEPLVPIQDPDRSFRVWSIEEIFGHSTDGRYVPNVGDAVWSWVEGLFRVTEVDYTTSISKLKSHVGPSQGGITDEFDILLGMGPGYRSESFRMLLDTSVIPHGLQPDRRTRLYGKDATRYKVFKGTNIGQTGEVISAYYMNGSFLGDYIPLELVAMEHKDSQNISVKACMRGYTMQKLEDGDLVTLVVYDDEGGPLSIQKFTIYNTGWIRASEEGKKYISSIAIDSPFLSNADPKYLDFPINLPVAGLQLMGVVNYSDGSKRRIPIDGTKFNLYGIDNYVASIEDQVIPLSLAYKLGPEEYTYNASPSINKHMSERYWARTRMLDGAYSVKLFAYPTWVSALVGYRMQFFLYNLDREEVYNVTSLIELAEGSAPFDGTAFGVVQKLRYVVDLNKVDGKFAAYRHPQTFEVALLAPGSQNTNNWSIGFSPGQDPPYGLGLSAKMTFVNVNQWKLKIDCGLPNLQRWLDEVFYNTQPLYNAEREARAPEPNYFVLVFGGREIEYPISQWNAELLVPNDLLQGQLVYIRFLRREPTAGYQLGISALPVHINQVANQL